MSQRNCQNVEIWTPNLHNSNQMPQTILYDFMVLLERVQGEKSSTAAYVTADTDVPVTCYQLATKAWLLNVSQKCVWYLCSFLVWCVPCRAYRSHTSSRQTWAARIWEERFCYIFGDRQTTIVWLFKPARCPFQSKTVDLHAQNSLRFWNELRFQELCNSATCPRNMMWIDVEVGWFKAILNMVDFPCSLRPWPTPWPFFSVRSCIRWMCCIDCRIRQASKQWQAKISMQNVPSSNTCSKLVRIC